MEQQTTPQQDGLVRLVRDRVHAKYPDVPADGACLYLAAEMVLALQDAGYTDVWLQAGSASWPRLRPEQDHGVSDTHFSYAPAPPSSASRAGGLAAGASPPPARSAPTRKERQ